ncbi:MAG TPA: SRPBCC domain-containing protein, partial [Chitinophagaceae bacterium]|nr:SRPBCC domain-containing protein [Chitinophagaceae bacterium]
VSIIVPSSPGKLFDSLTKKINEWWSEDFEGNAGNFDEVFTVRFGETFKRFKIEDIVPDRKITWYCLDAYINSSKLANKSEWRGTRVIWEISQEDDNTVLSFTHRGLTPALECYETCESGWNEFLESLRKYMTTGKGVPYKTPAKAL